MCTSPFKLKQGKFKTIEVSCGACDECKLQYRKMWANRMSYEKLYHKKSCFVTLTYDPEHLPEGGTLVKRDLQLYLKRLRKRIGNEKVRYFACGEYGGEHCRPHYHIIFYGLNDGSDDFYDLTWNSSHQGYDCKSYSWPYGRVTVDPATDSAIGYVAGYVTKKVKDKKNWYKERGILPEFVLMSRKPGIGERYMRENYNRLKTTGYIIRHGLRYPLPRYYEDKLFLTDEEKELRHDTKIMSLTKDKAQMRAYCRKYNLNFHKFLEDTYAQRAKNIKALLSLKRKGELNE